MKKFMVLRVLIAATVLAGAAAWLSCGENQVPSDEENIGSLINGKYAAYFNDGQTMGGGNPGGRILAGPGGFGDGAATLPVWWWRTITYGKRSLTISLEAPFTKADVTVRDEIRGTMYVDRTNDNILNPGSKPFAVLRTRYATFERADADSPWELTAISIAEYRLQEDEKRTVTIDEVRVVGENGFDKTYRDPTELHPLSELPTFEIGEKVTVTAKAHNTSTEGWEPVSFGFMHHDWTRDNMSDLGNETYKREYTVGTKVGVHHGGVDILDAGTLQNENEDDYNGHAWGLPYHVQ